MSNSSSDSRAHKLEQLMRLSQQGDRDAFAQLCEMRREHLVSEVRAKIDRRLLARVDASDVIQEVFWDAHRRLSEVANTQMPLIAWLRFLVNQKIIDLQRKHILTKKRSVSREHSPGRLNIDIDSIAKRIVSNITSPSMRVHREDVADRVRKLLKELSPLDREVLVMRHFQGMSNREVGESLGLNSNAASNRYIRALKRFKKVLDLNHDDFADLGSGEFQKK